METFLNLMRSLPAGVVDVTRSSADEWIFKLSDYIPSSVRFFQICASAFRREQPCPRKMRAALRPFKLDAESCCSEKAGRYVESLMLTMDFLVTDPEHWRERAESIRVTANLLNDATSKARMLKIAEGYEVLGRQTEKRRHTGW